MNNLSKMNTFTLKEKEDHYVSLSGHFDTGSSSYLTEKKFVQSGDSKNKRLNALTYHSRMHPLSFTSTSEIRLKRSFGNNMIDRSLSIPQAPQHTISKARI